MAEAGTVRYNHPDPASGLVEQEYNHLFVGMVQAPLRPDPEEVEETAFVTAQELAERHASAPFSAWFMTVLDAARPAVKELTGARAAGEPARACAVPAPAGPRTGVRRVPAVRRALPRAAVRQAPPRAPRLGRRGSGPAVPGPVARAPRLGPCGSGPCGR